MGQAKQRRRLAANVTTGTTDKKEQFAPIKRYDLATKLDVAGYTKHAIEPVAALIEARSEQFVQDLEQHRDLYNSFVRKTDSEITGLMVDYDRLYARVALLELTPWDKLRLWIERLVDRFYATDEILDRARTQPIAADGAMIPSLDPQPEGFENIDAIITETLPEAPEDPFPLDEDGKYLCLCGKRVDCTEAHLCSDELLTANPEE